MLGVFEDAEARAVEERPSRPSAFRHVDDEEELELLWLLLLLLLLHRVSGVLDVAESARAVL